MLFIVEYLYIILKVFIYIMYARTLYISTLYILTFSMSMRTMMTTLALRQFLLDQATRDEEAGDGIEHTVYIATTRGVL